MWNPCALAEVKGELFSLVNTVNDDRVVNIKTLEIESVDNLTLMINMEEQAEVEVISKKEMTISSSGKKEN